MLVRLQSRAFLFVCIAVRIIATIPWYSGAGILFAACVIAGIPQPIRLLDAEDIDPMLTPELEAAIDEIITEAAAARKQNFVTL